MSNALTERQKRILNFIRNFTRANSYSPTIREICDGCDISSTSVCNYNLELLQDLGLLKRQKGITRSIVLIDRVGV